jgi:hypothetical protein
MRFVKTFGTIALASAIFISSVATAQLRRPQATQNTQNTRSTAAPAATANNNSAATATLNNPTGVTYLYRLLGAFEANRGNQNRSANIVMCEHNPSLPPEFTTKCKIIVNRDLLNIEGGEVADGFYEAIESFFGRNTSITDHMFDDDTLWGILNGSRPTILSSASGDDWVVGGGSFFAIYNVTCSPSSCTGSR